MKAFFQQIIKTWKLISGEKWQDKSFEFECLRGGQQKLLGCIGENNVRIPVGGTKEINGYLMKWTIFGLMDK